MRGLLNRAAAAVLAVCVTAGVAHAQLQPRMIQGPTYGEIRAVLGDALMIAEPSPSCSADGSLAPGYCFDRILAFMRRSGASTLRVLAPMSAPQQGAQLNAETPGLRWFTVTIGASGAVAEALNLRTSGVRVPRQCYALPGEGVRYRFETNGGELVAQEVQTVSCGGGPQSGPPYVPQGATIPATAPAIGASAQTGGDAWGATGQTLARGALRELAYVRPDCDPAAIVRDNLCFAGPLTLMSADPNADDIDTLGVNRPLAAGDRVDNAEIRQLVLKRRRNGFRADGRWSPRFTAQGPAGCGAEARFFDIVEQNGRLMAHESVLATCGAPGAPDPAAIYEVYGAIKPLAEPGGCPQELYLFGNNICFGSVASYMQQNTIWALEALVVNQNWQEGTRIHSHGGMFFEFADVRMYEDRTFRAGRKRDYEPEIRAPQGCRSLDNAPSEASGLVIVNVGGRRMAQAYRWMACPF